MGVVGAKCPLAPTWLWASQSAQSLSNTVDCQVKGHQFGSLLISRLVQTAIWMLLREVSQQKNTHIRMYTHTHDPRPYRVRALLGLTGCCFLNPELPCSLALTLMTDLICRGGDS